MGNVNGNDVMKEINPFNMLQNTLKIFTGAFKDLTSSLFGGNTLLIIGLVVVAIILLK